MKPLKYVEKWKVWGDAHLLWFREPLIDDEDKGPKQKHFIKAHLQLLVDKHFMLDSYK